MNTEQRRTAMDGAVWSVVGLVVSQTVRLGANIVLVRFLFPESFGAMALVSVFLQSLELFSDLGIGAGVTQSPRGLEKKFLETAFTLQVLRGLALALATCLFAVPFARFYEMPELASYVLASAVGVAFKGLESPAILVLQRAAALRALFPIEFAAQALSTAVMIGLAVATGSVWSLVIGGIVRNVTRCVLSYAMYPGHRPSFGIDRSAARELLSFGKWLFFSSAMTFIWINGDRIMLGKLVPAEQLGIYGIAVAYTGLTVQFASQLLSSVLFPLLARVQDDPARLVHLFIAARRSLLLASLGLCAAVIAGAPLFFELAYPEEYADAGPYAQWLMLARWAAILAGGIELVGLSLGESRTALVATTLRASGVLTGALGFQLAGIPGLVSGFAASSLLALVVVTLSMPSGRIRILRQCAEFSLILAAYAAIAQGVAAATEDAGLAIRIAVTAVLALAPLALPLAVAKRLRASRAAPGPTEPAGSQDAAEAVESARAAQP